MPYKIAHDHSVENQIFSDLICDDITMVIKRREAKGQQTVASEGRWFIFGLWKELTQSLVTRSGRKRIQG